MVEQIANGMQRSRKTIPCPICGEQIQRGARKCIHCSSYLDWRRYTATGASTVPVLAAAVAILATASPWLLSFFTPNASKLYASFGGVGTSMLNGEVVLNLDNKGSKVDVFNAAMLRVGWRKDNRDLSFDIPLGNGEGVPVRHDYPVTLRLAIDLSSQLNSPTTAADVRDLLTAKIPSDYSTSPLATAACMIRVDSTGSNGGLVVQVISLDSCLPFGPWVADSVYHNIK